MSIRTDVYRQRYCGIGCGFCLAVGQVAVHPVFDALDGSAFRVGICIWDKIHISMELAPFVI